VGSSRSVAVRLVIAVGVVGAGVAVAATGVLNPDPANRLFPVLTDPTAAASGLPGGIDYNCNLPGNGCPWLECQPWEPPEYVGDVPPAVFWSTFGPDFQISMPLERGPDGGVDYAEVYETLCRVHPDLGGTDARPLSSGEKHMLSDLGVPTGSGRFVPVWVRGCHCCTIPDQEDEETICWTSYGDRWDPSDIGDCDAAPPLDCREVAGRWDTSWEGYYTDGVSGGQQMRVYWLPPIPQDWLDELTSDTRCESTAALPTSTTEQTTTTTKPETQRWQVSISGYEIDEMNRYWRITTQVRGALRYDYNLQGEFTLRKVDGKWVFDTGKITFAEVEIKTEYQPEGSWGIQEISCPQCDRISAGRTLGGTVTGDDLRLSWGTFRPEVKIYARIIVPCRPMPDCAEWKNRTFESTEFFQNINGQLLPLVEGFTSSPPYVDPAAGLRWLDYTIVLRRVAG